MKTFKYPLDLSRSAMDQYGIAADQLSELQYLHNKACWEAKGAPPLPLTSKPRERTESDRTRTDSGLSTEDESDGEGPRTVKRLGGKVMEVGKGAKKEEPDGAAEAANASRSARKQRQKQDLDSAFAEFDTDKSGGISLDEFTAL